MVKLKQIEYESILLIVQLYLYELHKCFLDAPYLNFFLMMATRTKVWSLKWSLKCLSLVRNAMWLKLNGQCET